MAPRRGIRSMIRKRLQRSNQSHASTSFPVCIGDALAEPDHWHFSSAAYRKAATTFRQDLDVAILEVRNVEELFQQLQEFDKHAKMQDSLFLRGDGCLRSLQVRLERLKLTLDLASSLSANLNPAANAVVDNVKGVTTTATSLTAADREFSLESGGILEHISYIADCESFDQMSNGKDTHNPFVVTYKKILKLYKAVYQALARKASRFILRIILQNSHLRGIVEDFLREAETLRRLVEAEDWEIIQDTQQRLYDEESQSPTLNVDIKHYLRDLLNEEAVSRWLGSERMRMQQDRHDALIYATADEACDFLLNEPEFLEWYESPHSQQLAIFGDMGTGKSCAMAFLVEELGRRNGSELPGPKLCYYYCQDKKTGTAVDIYCCLILALLRQFGGLKQHFHHWYEVAQASGMYAPSANLETRELFLERILEALDCPLFIVIDGLDKCDEASRSRLMNFLHDTGRTGPAVKAILSCRPRYEIIKELGNTSKIYLRSGTQRDRVIAKKLVEIHLSNLSKEVQTLVVENLTSRANGSAIWTEMMVKQIAMQGIRAADPMRRFIKSHPLPERLSELYLTLLSDQAMGSSENEELASIALNVLAASRRHMSILELSWAVALCLAPREVNSVASLSELVDHERVMSLIQAFIARVDFDDLKKRQVRLVHQSVKEFARQSLKPTRLRMCGQRVHNTEDHDYEHTCSDEEDYEAGLLNICIRYLLLDEIDQIEIFSDEQRAIEELPQDVDLFDEDLNPAAYDAHCAMESWEQDMPRYDPASRGLGELFAYASCHWTDHFGAVTAAAALPRLADVEKLCRAGSVRLRNWTGQNCRPDCTIPARFGFDGGLYDPLSITSLYGSAAALRGMLDGSGLGGGDYFADTAKRAAEQILRWGDLGRLEMLLLESKFRNELHTDEFSWLMAKCRSG